MKLSIGDNKIDGKRCFIIGEIGQAHDGSLGMAHAYIDAIAEAGADAVKFQTHIAEAESSPQEPWRIKFSQQDASRFDYWKRMEFTLNQWIGLKEHVESKGLIFLSSPFSLEAVELLNNIGMVAWKVASGEISSLLLLEKIIQTQKPILISTGMSPLSEIDRVVDKLRSRSCQFAVMQCSSFYPTTPDKLGLNLLNEYRARYGCPVGLSDHSGTIFAGLAAATIGMDILEVHVTFSREMFGPDVVASVTTTELRQLIDGIRFIEQAKAFPIDKNAIANEFEELRKIFSKSLFLALNLSVGTRLERNHLVARKPGDGISPDLIDTVIGRQLLIDVKKGEMLTLEHLGPF